MKDSVRLPSIYGLFDSDGALRYIGKANCVKSRLKGHMRDSREKRGPLYNWIRKNGEPEIRVLEADCVDWEEAERRLIKEARERGERLLNVAEGGNQPYCSTAQRRKNGHASIDRFRNGTNHKGKVDTKEALIRDAHNWCLEFAKSRGLPALLERTEQRMRALYAEDPKTYKSWASV